MNLRLGKMLAKDISDKGPLCKIYKEFLKLSEKTHNVFTKWAKHLYRHPTQEDIQMADEHMK